MINQTSTGQTLACLSLSASELSLAAAADDNDDVDDDDDVRLLVLFVSATLSVSGSSTDDDDSPLLTLCNTPTVPVKERTPVCESKKQTFVTLSNNFNKYG